MNIFKKLLKKREKAKKQEKIIKEIMEKSGWSRSMVIDNVQAAKKISERITYNNFLKNSFYLLNDVEREAAIKKWHEKQCRKDDFVAAVMEKYGWTRSYANKRMKECLRKYGISYREFNNWNIGLLDEDQIIEIRNEKRESRRLRAERNKKIHEEDYKKDILNVVNSTGWDEETAIKNIKYAQAKTGCGVHEYSLYRMWEIDESIWNTMFFSGASFTLSNKYDKNKVVIDILYDKEASNVFLNDYMAREWCVNTEISEDDFVEKFKNSKKLFYKPIVGHHGDGATPYTITKDNIHDVYNELSKKSKGVVEEYLVQHHKLNELAPGAVNTVRVVTISSKANPVTPDGKHIVVAYMALKMGGINSVVDNLANGGFGAGINMDTGELDTDAIDISGNTYKQHPVTGTTIRGFKIPYFEKIFELVNKVYEEKHVEGFLGWDVAITENGPAVIEINAYPSPTLLQYPYVPERIGKKYLLEKYL